jgi:hypothetical protein
MRGSLWNSGKGTMARAAMAVALASGLGFGAMVAPAIAKEAKKEEGGGNSKEFAAAAGPFRSRSTTGRPPRARPPMPITRPARRSWLARSGRWKPRPRPRSIA